jgi:hypothetical protein
MTGKNTKTRTRSESSAPLTNHSGPELNASNAQTFSTSSPTNVYPVNQDLPFILTPINANLPHHSPLHLKTCLMQSFDQFITKVIILLLFFIIIQFVSLDFDA